jgi:putative hydrolase of the HAD superfamily
VLTHSVPVMLSLSNTCSNNTTYHRQYTTLRPVILEAMLLVVQLAAVLFDLDGTLLDHEAASTAAVSSWLSSHGASRTDIESAVPLWFELEQRHYPAWCTGEITFQEQRRRRTRDFFLAVGITVRAEDLDAAFAEYLTGYEAAWTAYDDAAPALLRVAAAGLRSGILTNGDQAQQTAKLVTIGLIDHCGPVFSSSVLPAQKPDHRAFTEACRRLGVDPARVLMVGDNYEVDILGARAAGLSAIHLDRLAEHPETNNERISTLHDLLADSSRGPADR